MIPYSVHADFIPSIKRYQIFVDLRFLMQFYHVNGDYNLHVHVEDTRALAPFDFKLGTLHVDFSEGTTENGSNIGVHEDY